MIIDVYGQSEYNLDKMEQVTEWKKINLSMNKIVKKCRKIK